MLVYDGFSPIGCEVSEKFDGICAIWDGARLTTRDGNVLDAPAWFVAGLPAEPLRGELWCGRGQFEQVLSICKAQASGVRWRDVRYMVFDGSSDAPLGEFAQHVDRRTVQSAAELDAMFKAIVDEGGEGVVIRDATGTDHKHKPISDDDAVVIGHAEGKGRNAGRCGALLVRDREWREFRIGTGLSDELRATPPAVGAVVTFCFQGRTRTGKPRFASFVGIRAEATLDFASA